VSLLHLAVGVSLIVVMTQMHGQNPLNTRFTGGTLLSVNDEMNRSSPQAIKMTIFFFQSSSIYQRRKYLLATSDKLL